MSNYIIETKHLTKQYGTQKSVADLSIHVEKGRIYGLLGRNGAGKTTTMKMLLGLTRPTSGEVKIWGKPLQGNEKKLLPRIGSLIESYEVCQTATPLKMHWTWWDCPIRIKNYSLSTHLV